MTRVARLATDVGPAGLVPAAWGLTVAAVFTPLVTDRTLLIALVVMDVLLAAFYVATRDEMTGPVLGAWRRVLVAGLAANLVGTAGLLVAPGARALLAVPLYAWMVLPGLGYVRTWRETPTGLPRALYGLSAAGSLVGAGLYAVAPLVAGGDGPAALAGLVAVGAGQTAGIVTAAVENAGS
ncbi:MAG: hypothetical protein ABEH47_06825 [Haloferacaceae archaeon]